MKILDIALKDLTRSARSFFLIGMGLVAPLGLTLLIYFAFGSFSGGETKMVPIKVGVVNSDVSSLDIPLETSLGETVRNMFFDESVQSWITAAEYADETAARYALDTQEIGVAVIIPETFTSDFWKGESRTQITVLQDPTLTIAPTVVRDMITSLLDGVSGGGIAYRVINARLEANQVPPDPTSMASLLGQYANWYVDYQRALFHTPEKAALIALSPAPNAQAEDSLQMLMGPVMAGQLIFFSFFTGAYAMMSILQEDEEGTLARLFTTPTDRTTIMMGKFLAVFLTVLFQGTTLLVAGSLFFGIRWGQSGAVLLAVAGQMFASVGLAVLLVSFIKTSKQAGPIFGGALTGLGMISGLFTTNINMPAAFNALGNFTPQGWVLKAWKYAIAGQPIQALFTPFIVLVAMGVIMFVIGTLKFRNRYA